jgi:hypothetical protein
LDVAEGNIKIVSGLDPDELRNIYRMEGCSVQSADEVQKVLRDLVERFLKENPNPKVYILDDPGLLINVKNQIH